MGEERYIKQIISDVMEMAAKIKFLEAKVAASESWSAECTDDHTRELAAALRRAQAEGKLEGMEEAAILVEAMPMATPYNTALSLRWVVKERREADARAAQIEEG